MFGSVLNTPLKITLQNLQNNYVLSVNLIIRQRATTIKWVVFERTASEFINFLMIINSLFIYTDNYTLFL